MGKTGTGKSKMEASNSNLEVPFSPLVHNIESKFWRPYTYIFGSSYPMGPV